MVVRIRGTYTEQCVYMHGLIQGQVFTNYCIVFMIIFSIVYLTACVYLLQIVHSHSYSADEQQLQ